MSHSGIYSIVYSKINQSEFWDRVIDHSHNNAEQGKYQIYRRIIHQKPLRGICFAGTEPEVMLLVREFLHTLTPGKEARLIIQEFNYDFDAYESKSGLKRLAHFVYLSLITRACASISVHSKQQFTALKRTFPKSRAKLNYVRLPRHHTVAERDSNVEVEDYALVAGRIRDFEILFKARERLSRQGLKIKLVTYRFQRKQIDPLVHEYGSEDIEIVYSVDRSKYVEILRRARFVILASKHSGRSNCQLGLLDSYAAGKATLCANSANISDYYEEGTALTYQPGDVDDFIAKALMLHSDDALRDRVASAGHRYLDQFPDKDSFARQIVGSAFPEYLPAD